MSTIKRGLKIEPEDIITFSGDLSKEVRVTFSVTNKSDQKLAYKIKCTKNDAFKISNAIDVIPSGQQRQITITYRPIAEEISDRHHIGIYYIPAPEGCTANSVWKEHYGPPCGEYRLRINMDPTQE
ncbi:hypothetical protein PRIPAC_75113 [Pristionchus pacificus]|uniref:Major sperm protein n=1 Tax=Pristionchus pacificus TaxID=54126 RepID=A0A2A6BFW1_PRIPA|nr:hypothetical protein PRIPAC_75113 [Pristionchus pacificus]|eukprot:PDM64805.1 MSP domain-containing protein [Pristionchus pacificus]